MTTSPLPCSGRDSSNSPFPSVTVPRGQYLDRVGGSREHQLVRNRPYGDSNQRKVVPKHPPPDAWRRAQSESNRCSVHLPLPHRSSTCRMCRNELVLSRRWPVQKEPTARIGRRLSDPAFRHDLVPKSFPGGRPGSDQLKQRHQRTLDRSTSCVNGQSGHWHGRSQKHPKRLVGSGAD